MKMRLFLCAALLSPGTLFAQEPVLSQASPSDDAVVLQSGAELPLRLAEDLTTKGKRLRVGQQVRLETAKAVLVDGVIVPVGAAAVGEITAFKNKGMWGKSGRLSGRVLYLNANGRQIRLTGEFNDKGKAGGVGAVATSAFIWLPAGFFMTGTSATLSAGTVVKAVVDGGLQPEPAAAAAILPFTVAGLNAPPGVQGAEQAAN